MKSQKLAVQLAEWERQGLITAEQSGGIIDYESSRRTVPWVLYSFIMLGVTIIAVGIISLVAANWADIPAGVKLTADFSLLIGLAACLFRFGDGAKPAVFDSIAAFFILLCLASIGLISQIYHTGGELYQALFLWCCITLPVTLFAFRRFIPNLWVAAFLMAFISYLLHETRPGGDDSLYRLALLWSLPLTAFLAAVFCRSLRPLGLLVRPFLFWAAMFLLGATVYFDMAHSAGFIFENSAHPARLFHYSGYGSGQAGASATIFYVLVDALTAAAIAAIFYMKGLDKKTRILLSLLAVLFCIMMNIYGCIDYASYEKHYSSYAADYPLFLKLLGPSVCISMLLLLSFLFAGLNFQRLFSLCINLIGLRFLIIYFQVFGTLASTGIGLIVSGLIIIAAVAVWYKSRKKVQAWLGGLLG